MKISLYYSALVLLCLSVIPSTGSDISVKPMDSHEARELAEMAREGVDACAILGRGWVSNAEIVRSLNGWTGRINGIAITFSNPLSPANGAPGSFRIIRTNWDKVEFTSRTDTSFDRALSVTDHGYWYYSPGSYMAEYPEQLENTLTKLREFFHLPKAVSNMACRLQGGSRIIPVGKPIPIQAGVDRLQELLPRPRNLPDDWPHRLTIINPSGVQLILRTPMQTELFKRQRLRYRKGVIEDTQWGADISEIFDMTKPGIYKIRLRCPLENEEKTIMESQEISIRVVPSDFFLISLRSLNAGNSMKKGTAIPVEMDVKLKEGTLDQFQEIYINYAASRKIETYRPPYGEFYGSPIQENTQSVKASLQPGKNKLYRMRFDFAQGLWNSTLSSEGPMNSIWTYTSPGEKIYVWVIISSTIDGRRLELTSNILTIQIAK